VVKGIIEFNKKFVENKEFEKFITSKYPDKKLAILSCMDTRLTELLPAALGLKNGDAKIIKNAGGSISHPFGSVMRSLMIAIYDLGVNDIMVIGHTDCGVQGQNSKKMIDKMLERGISKESIDMVKYCGVDFDSWLKGFDSVEDSVSETVNIIKNHPLIPKDIKVYGYVMNSTTGELVSV